jgi:hypothetical protein
MVDLRGAIAVGYLARSGGLHPDTASSARSLSSPSSWLLVLSVKTTHKIKDATAANQRHAVRVFFETRDCEATAPQHFIPNQTKSYLQSGEGGEKATNLKGKQIKGVNQSTQRNYLKA